jgi:hypothetical protein
MLKIFLMINAILAVGFGLAFLFVPHQFASGYGIVLTPYAAVFANSVGGVLLGLGILMGLMVRTNDAKALQAVCVGGLLVHIANGVTDFMAMRGGVINGAGWGSVILHGLLAFGFLFFLLREPAK